jgi:hypothetical protein
VGHYPRIYVECEGTSEFCDRGKFKGEKKWPEGKRYPINWTKGITVPYRKAKYFMDRIKDNIITLHIKMNHDRNECLFTEGETVIDALTEKGTTDIGSSMVNMSRAMIVLDFDDLYYGFNNIPTFLKRKLKKHKNVGISRVFEMKKDG